METEVKCIANWHSNVLNMVDKQLLIQAFIEHKTIINLGKYVIVSLKLQDNESIGTAVMVNTIVKATVIM